MAGVLGGIGVANHHFLLTTNVLAVPAEVKELPHDRVRTAQIINRFKQRHHPQGRGHARLFLQKFYGKDVRSGLRH